MKKVEWITGTLLAGSVAVVLIATSFAAQAP